jgi:DNA-binding transcriptional MocR family regulator
MSNKIDLSDLRSEERSLTEEIVSRFKAAIDAGQLEAGERLPTVRALAEAAEVNHLTAARAYRRLAELGYVVATVGRGTFVRQRPAALPDGGDGEDWQSWVLPDRRSSYSGRIMQDTFRVSGRERVVSLAVGFPDPDLYPTAELARITAEVFADEGGAALSYLNAEGLAPLRERLAELGRRAGFATDAEEIIVTTGAHQGLDLVIRALLEPGDVAVVESPTFVGSLTALQGTGARVIGVPVDEGGFDVDALESVLARHEVKLVLLQTACQNPTGRDLVPERRRRLVELARERSFFVLEDGVYGTVRFEGEDQPRLRSLAPAHVIYVDSLSKTIGGGLRLGWLAARGPVLGRLGALKMASDVHTSSLTQHIAARYLADDLHDQVLAETLPVYRDRRDALLEALERHLPGEYRAHRPVGGHHLWVSLIRPLDERALYAEALRCGMTFTPGEAALAEPTHETTMRLSFSLLRPEQLDEGVRRLARAIRGVRREERLSATAPVS